MSLTPKPTDRDDEPRSQAGDVDASATLRPHILLLRQYERLQEALTQEDKKLLAAFFALRTSLRGIGAGDRRFMHEMAVAEDRMMYYIQACVLVPDEFYVTELMVPLVALMVRRGILDVPLKDDPNATAPRENDDRTWLSDSDHHEE